MLGSVGLFDRSWSKRLFLTGDPLTPSDHPSVFKTCPTSSETRNAATVAKRRPNTIAWLGFMSFSQKIITPSTRRPLYCPQTPSPLPSQRRPRMSVLSRRPQEASAPSAETTPQMAVPLTPRTSRPLLAAKATTLDRAAPDGLADGRSAKRVGKYLGVQILVPGGRSRTGLGDAGAGGQEDSGWVCGPDEGTRVSWRGWGCWGVLWARTDKRAKVRTGGIGGADCSSGGTDWESGAFRKRGVRKFGPWEPARRRAQGGGELGR